MTQAQALSIMKTGAHVFLTGEPGAGKTHTTNEYVAYLRARGAEVAITASTGIAATHIGGMTIHSWSGIGVKTKLEKRDIENIAKNKHVSKHVRHAQVLIIEEISMLSAATLALVDSVCRRVKQDPRPFGGIQIILVGDFFQLPPIIKRESAPSPQLALLSQAPARFAYDASVWKELRPKVCYLTEQHRQDDQEYLGILSAIRKNNFVASHLETLGKRKIEYAAAPHGVPKLFSHNVDVDQVNDEILAQLPGITRVFKMESHGHDALVSFLQRSCLSPQELRLKEGAAVMFTKNNQREGFVNGTLGRVESLDRESGFPSVRTRSGRLISTEPMDWVVEEHGETRARITQIPLRLAWAITVHKSQGMSLDAAVVDLGGVFEFGQGYVALSRVRRLTGLYLLGWNERAFQVHPEVLAQDTLFRAQSDATLHELARTPQPEALNYETHASGTSLSGTEVLFPPKKVAKEQPLPARAKKKKGDGFAKILEKHTPVYRPWDEEQDSELREQYLAGASITDLAREFSRTRGSIHSRLKKLSLTTTE